MDTNDARATLRGERVILRSPVESDKENRRQCGRDPEFYRMVGGDPDDFAPLAEEDIEIWYANHRDREHHWIIEYQQRCIGSTRITHIDDKNRRGHYNIGIFDRSAWGIGLGTEVTRLVVAYGFEHLKLHRLEVRVLDFNVRAIRAYEKAGFVREGLEREGSLIGGEWCTDVPMGILEYEFRKGDQ